MKEIIVYNTSAQQLNSVSQWSRDVYITIRETDITSAYNIHFFNTASQIAYVMESTYSNGVLTVKIPNILLMYPFDIIGNVFQEDSSGAGQAIARFRFMVIPRPKPSDCIYPGTVDYLSYAEIMENCTQYAISEANRVIAEDGRISAENSRVNAEKERVSNETNRINAENTRVATEKTRQNAEAERASNETKRVGAENARATSETNRASEEAKRASAETARATAETARSSAETTRETNEVARIAAENARESVESTRVESEANRINAEGQRIANEQNRITQENIRINNESLRVNAESDRAAAENARMAAWVNAEGMQQITAVNLDNSDKYIYQFVMSGSHMGFRMTKIEESTEENL